MRPHRRAPFRLASASLLAVGCVIPATAEELSATAPVVIDPSPRFTGNLPWVALLCRFADTAVVPQPPEWFAGLIGEAYPGLGDFYRTSSYGRMTLTGSRVVGWVTLPEVQSAYDHYTAGLACLAAADPLVDYREYYGIHFFFSAAWPGEPPNTASGGRYSFNLDGANRHWATDFMSPNLGPPRYYDIGIAAHEVGHGFHWQHSSRPVEGFWADSPWDIMSGPGHCSAGRWPYSAWGCAPQDTIGAYKYRAGWLLPSERTVIGPGTAATVLLRPLAYQSGPGVVVAMAPVGSTPRVFYSVEARRRLGYDGPVPGDAVLIHVVDFESVTNGKDAYLIIGDESGDPRGPGAQWTPGEEFVDAAAGIRIRVESETSEGWMVTIENDPAYVRPTLSVTSVTSPEGAGAATLTAQLSSPSSRYVSAAYEAIAGTATEGADFPITLGRITFDPGQTVATFQVPLRDDSLDEDDETLTVRLLDASATVLAASAVTVTIQDDDPPPVLEPRDATVEEGTGGGSPALRFVLSLSVPSGRAVSGSLARTLVTAGPGDVGSVPASFVIPAGATAASFDIPVTPDAADEPNEVLLVSLAGVANAVPTRQIVQGTILDDDGRVALCRPIAYVPFTITQQGRHCLARNLSTAITTGAAITIAADYVLLDLAGFKLGGGAAGPATDATGIRAVGRRNIVVRNGNVRGFRIGIEIRATIADGTGGHVLAALRLDDHTDAGIVAEGSGIQIRQNQVIRIGGGLSPGDDGPSSGIRLSGPGGRVLGNDVSVVTGDAAGEGYAVWLDAAPGAVAEGNRITDASQGIRVTSGTDVMVAGNRLARLDAGIVFQGATGKYARNVAAGVATPYIGGTDAGGNDP